METTPCNTEVELSWSNAKLPFLNLCLLIYELTTWLQTATTVNKIFHRLTEVKNRPACSSSAFACMSNWKPCCSPIYSYFADVFSQVSILSMSCQSCMHDCLFHASLSMDVSACDSTKTNYKMKQWSWEVIKYPRGRSHFVSRKFLQLPWGPVQGLQAVLPVYVGWRWMEMLGIYEQGLNPTFLRFSSTYSWWLLSKKHCF